MNVRGHWLKLKYEKVGSSGGHAGSNWKLKRMGVRMAVGSGTAGTAMAVQIFSGLKKKKFVLIFPRIICLPDIKFESKKEKWKKNFQNK